MRQYQTRTLRWCSDAGTQEDVHTFGLFRERRDSQISLSLSVVTRSVRTKCSSSNRQLHATFHVMTRRRYRSARTPPHYITLYNTYKQGFACHLSIRLDRNVNFMTLLSSSFIRNLSCYLIVSENYVNLNYGDDPSVRDFIVVKVKHSELA